MFYDYSHQFYNECNQILKDKTYNEFPLVRLFSSYEEQNTWLSKAPTKQFTHILSEKEKKIKHVKNDFGNGILKKSAKLNASTFLENIKEYFLYKNKYREESFSFENIYKDGHQFKMGEDRFKYLISCQGPFLDALNPFHYLPLIPNKGEILEIHSSQLPQYILSRGIFTIPMGENKFRIGATYNKRDLTKKTTDMARLELVSKLNKMLCQNDIKIQNHIYGFRPTTIDRKPLVGRHPVIKNAFIFNGMGSKSILMAPLLGKQLVEYILFGKKLPEVIDVSRFDHYFSAQHHQLCSKLVT